MSKKPKKAKSPLKSKPKAKAKAKAKKSFELKGEIVRMGRTHGFIREIPFKEVKEEPQEYFVSGRDLLGAVIGDVVLFERVQSRFERTEGSLQEVRVTRVLKQTKELLTGVIVADATTGELCLAPDSFGARYPLEIAKQERCPKGRALPDRRGELDENAGGIADYAAGDKVAFTLKSRGEKHHLHIAEITSVFGEAKKARVCVAAYLEEKRITTTFPTACDSEAKDCGEIIDECEIPKRVDLRDMPIFTIDGADTKDIDDAINIERVRGGYRLGVHIADVSHYVTHGSELDKEAFERGTSVYIADLVVPMLPKALSNGICSLNPDVDRLAFSCIMDVGKSGELKSFEFKKSVIRSKVQGVYSEINEILRCRKSRKRPAAELGEKYAEVKDQLVIMLELAQTLKAARAGRGSPSLESAEPKIICDDEGRCVDIIRRETGEDIVAEGIIEEFMLLANNAAARLAMEIKLPFVYRVHEQPAVEKLTRLSETLAGLGISTGELKPTAESLSNVIKVVGEQFPDKLDVINMAVLRSMMKAKYSDEPLGHFGLCMKEYAHFTSPIRRYPDLSIHRILTEHVAGRRIKSLLHKFAHESAVKSTFAELKAVSAERDCNGFYMAEYMSEYIGQEFDGTVTGLTEVSVFVMLDNTVEGRVSFRNPEGGFSGISGDTTVENGVTLANKVTGERYTLGDKVRVKCVGCSVPMGTVDFEIVKAVKGGNV